MGSRDRGNWRSAFGDVEAGSDPLKGVYDQDGAEEENDRALGELSERVNILKRVTLDINSEVDAQHKMLDRMGQDMDGTRGLLGGTMDRFQKVMANKSSRNTVYLVVGGVILFLVIYYMRR